jgi:hypothetical protein
VSVVCSQVDVPPYHSSREILPSVVCLSVIAETRQCRRPGILGLSRHKNLIDSVCSKLTSASQKYVNFKECACKVD